jgi:hypothetical protein
MCIYFKYVFSDFLLFLDESWPNLIDGSTWVTYQLLPTLLSLLLKSNSWHSLLINKSESLSVCLPIPKGFVAYWR